MDRARKIFARTGHLSPKDVIERFIEAVPLTRAGAATYFYKIAGESKRKRTKADRARAVLRRMKKASRKETIRILVERVALTRAGASSYYHRYKSSV